MFLEAVEGIVSTFDYPRLARIHVRMDEFTIIRRGRDAENDMITTVSLAEIKKRWERRVVRSEARRVMFQPDPSVDFRCQLQSNSQCQMRVNTNGNAKISQNNDDDKNDKIQISELSACHSKPASSLETSIRYHHLLVCSLQAAQVLDE